MPYVVSLSPRAQKNVIQIEQYLAERFYPQNARRFVERLLEACDSLVLAPFRGTGRDDLRPGIRTVGFERKATIYFKVVGDHIVIVSIMYRGRTRGSLP